MAGVKLFGCRLNAVSCRVEIALKVKGVQYEFEENPDLSMPVLMHNEKPIMEVGVILEYIEETWKGNPILPEDPYERAMARFSAKFIDTMCMPALWKAFQSKEQKAIDEACEVLKRVEEGLKDNKYFGGDNIGLADIVADFIAFWVGVIQQASGVELLTRAKFPKLCVWIDNFLNCKAVKEALPPRDHLLTFFQAQFPAPNAYSYMI